MSNLSRKIPLFQQKLAEKKLGKVVTARRSTEWCFTDECKNISISKLHVHTGVKNLASALQKIRKLDISSLITRRNIAPEKLEYDRS